MSTTLERDLPRQKRTDPKLHYVLCGTTVAVGVVLIGLVILGANGVPLLDQLYPWLTLAAIIVLIPSICGLYRGPGEPSTHLIPRPRNRSPIDPAAGAGGAGGPVPRH